MSYINFDNQFTKITTLGEGSYGKVYLCCLKQNGMDIENSEMKQNSQPNTMNSNSNFEKAVSSEKYFALKKLKHIKKSSYSYEQEQQKFDVQKLRQVIIMRLLKHTNLLSFTQIAEQDKGYKNNFYLVMPFGIQVLQFAKQKQIMLTKSLLKSIIYQIIKGLNQIHAQRIIHRDIKPDNIFVMNNGVIKIGDFSLSRKINSVPQIYMQQENNLQVNQNKMSGNVTTRYYRAPQIMYGSRNYTQKIDIWSLGCTIAELILHQPIFPGQTDINQLELIFKIIGFPQQHWPKAVQLPYYLEFTKDKEELKLGNVLPDVQPQLLSLIEGCLQLDPEKRYSTTELIEHPYFQNVQENPVQLCKLADYLHCKKLNQFTKNNK